MNENPFATLILTQKALKVILAQTVGLLDRDDRDELSNALAYTNDLQTLDKNSVKTPLTFYK